MLLLKLMCIFSRPNQTQAEGNSETGGAEEDSNSGEKDGDIVVDDEEDAALVAIIEQHNLKRVAT